MGGISLWAALLIIAPDVVSSTVHTVFCDPDASDFAYQEQIVNTTTRAVTVNGCPNHFHENQIGTNTHSAVREVKTYYLPKLPEYNQVQSLNSFQDIVTKFDASSEPVGVLFSGATIRSQYVGDDETVFDTFWNTNDETAIRNLYTVSALATLGDTVDFCNGYSSSSTEPSYHFTQSPRCLLNQLTNYTSDQSGAHSPQIGWALDGFPIYGPFGPTGERMQQCSINPTPPCLDQCNGLNVQEEPQYANGDGYFYRYYLTESPNAATKTCSTAPAAPSDGADYFPATPMCLRGCCPAGYTCSAGLADCGGAIPAAPGSVTFLRPTFSATASLEANNAISSCGDGSPLPVDRCGSSNQHYEYNETITDNSGADVNNGAIRRIHTNACPNHYFENFVGRDAVEANYQYLSRQESHHFNVPSDPMLTSTQTDVSGYSSPIGVLFNGGFLHSQYIGSGSAANDYAHSAVNLQGSSFDACGGTSFPNSRYKFYLPPSCLLKQLGDQSGPDITAASPQIGWAMDGFPVYGPRGYGGTLLKRCSLVDNQDPCLDECGGSNDTRITDGYAYRYHVMGPMHDSDTTTACTSPLSIMPDAAYFPFTPICLRGCCPSGYQCSMSNLPVCGSEDIDGYSGTPTRNNMLSIDSSSCRNIVEVQISAAQLYQPHLAVALVAVLGSFLQ